MMCTQNMISTACLLILVACSDATTTPHAPKIDGHWEGEHDGIAFAFDLEGYGNYVGGQAVIADSVSEYNLAVMGTVGGRRVSLTMVSLLVDPLTWVGGWQDRGTLRGALYGSGFLGDSVTLTRIYP